MLNVKSWMDSTQLKMNPTKTEFIYFGNRPQLDKCKVERLKVTEDLIIRSSSIKYLGIYMDEHLSFKQHVTKKCQIVMHNYFKIRSIRHFLDTPTTACLCLSLCMSHLDYSNSMLYGLPETTISKMQRIQNMCAHLALRQSKRDSIIWCIRELHWLPTKQRIEFKILTLTHKCINKAGPKYLQDIMSPQQPKHNGLRSA